MLAVSERGISRCDWTTGDSPGKPRVKILFWLSTCLVVYTYFGYPFVLWALTKFRSRNVLKREIFPRVSIIIAARNEADKIRQKIEHTLALDYPAERRNILVASDSCDDGAD